MYRLLFSFLIVFSCVLLRAQSPEVVVQLGHSFDISLMDKHPYKPWIATGAADNQVKIWDYNLRKLIITLKGHNDGIKLLKFMPGTDQYILSASEEDQTMILWDIQHSSKQKVYKHGNSFWPIGVAFSGADANGKPGKYFYVGHQFGIEKWETMTGTKVEDFNADTLIHDGKHHWVQHYEYVASTNCSYFADGTILYKLDHNTKLCTKEFTTESSISRLNYNATQKLMALACADHFYIIDISTNKELYKYKKVGNYYSHTACLSESGDLIFLNEEHQFSHIINWKENKDIIWFKGTTLNQCVFVEYDNYAIVTGTKGAPFMYNIHTLEYRPFYAIDNGVKSLTFFNNDRYLLKAGNESNVRIFDMQTADYTGALEGHNGMVWYATASKSGKYLATTSADQTIKIWDAASFKCITTIKSPYPIAELYSGDISSVAFKKVIFSDDDKYVLSFLQGNGALGKQNSYVWKWEVATGKLVGEYQHDVKKLAKNTFFSVDDIAVNPTKDELVVISYENLTILRCSDFKMIKKNADKETTWFSGVKFSKDGKWLVVNHNQGILDLWDAEKMVKVKSYLRMPPTYIFSLDFNHDGSLIAAAGGFDDNRVFIIDTKTFTIIKTLNGHDSWVRSVKWSADGSKLFSGGEDSKLIQWDLNKETPAVTLVNNANTEDYVFYNSEGQYKITRSGFKNVGFRSGLNLFPFEQFDIKFNRPDLILKSLGSDNTELIELYRKAYEKRLKQAGLSEEKLFKSFYTPQLFIEPLPYAVEDNKVKLKLTASDSIYPLKSYNVFVNEVPILGKEGKAIKEQQFTTELEVPLTSGINRIEVSCVNNQGAESLRKVFDVTTTYTFPKPELYLIGVSVSGYKDSLWNLKYAVKDGRDMASLFSKGFPKSYSDTKNENYFNKVNGGLLLDSMATREKFLRVKELLARSKPNDQVILFFSGHGLLDKKFDFYYATYDCDFKHPEQKGLSFSDIESVLDAAPARNKLLFIDACHSGEVDKEQLEVVADSNAVNGARGGVVAYKTRGAQMLETANSGMSLTNSFNLMKEIFAGSERGTGTVIVSAAAGDSYALESSQWNNGVFTYCILNGVKNGEADADKNKEITVTELKNYLIKEVYKQTNGRQKPTCRKENLEYDFRVR